MKQIKRMVAFVLTLAMVACVVCTGAPTRAAGDEVSPEKALQMVKDAFAKYQKHDTVAFTLDTPGSWSFYAYDFNTEVGARLTGVDSDYFSSLTTGLDDENDWVDYKKKVLYEGYYNDDEELEYSYYPMDADEIEDDKDYYFDYLTDAREDGFPIANSYVYGGRIWEYGPNNERHQCYIFEVPESDASLYENQNDAPYLPITVYVGVDDGELYRIDEERYLLDSMETNTNRYETHFIYPEPLSVPEDIVKNATLSSEYSIYKNGIEFFAPIEDSEQNLHNLCIYGFADNSTKKQKKNVKIPDTVSLAGRKYKVVYVGFEAFYREKKIRTVTLGKNIKEIDNEAFARCTGMKSLDFSGSKVEKIGKYVFDKCKSLTSLVLPDSVKSIGFKSFRDCHSLKKITIGKKIKKIDEMAFERCKSLKTIKIKNKKMRKYVNSSKGRKELGLSSHVEVV